MKRFVFVVLASLFLGACASAPVNRISIDQSKDIRAEKVAVGSMVVEKKINYIETLYRVLWLETKSSSMEFGGIWNPDDEFTGLVTKSLRGLDINSEALSSIVAPEVMESYRSALTADYLAHSTGKHPQIAGVNMAPAKTYFEQYPQYNEFEAVRDALLGAGYSYLFEYLGSDVYGNAPGYGMVVVTMPSQLRIIDLKKKTVAWSHIAFTHEVYQMGGNLKKLEENNLAKLKEALDVGIKKVMARETMAPMLLVDSETVSVQ